MYLHCALPRQLPASTGRKTISIKRKCSPQVKQPEQQFSLEKVNTRMNRSRGIAQVAKSVQSTERDQKLIKHEKTAKIDKHQSAEALQCERSTERHLQRLSSKEKPTFSRTPSVEKEKQMLATTALAHTQSERTSIQHRETITQFSSTEHPSKQLFKEAAPQNSRMVRMQNKACVSCDQPLPYTNFNMIEEKYSESYEGEYLNKMREGFGTVHFTNGEKYVGNWKASRVDGQGSFYRMDGTVVMGQWESNILTEIISQLNQLR